MSQRRVFVRESDQLYVMLGLVETTDFVHEVKDDSDGSEFTLAYVTDRYVIYARPTVDTEPDPAMPDAWRPFADHGLHDPGHPAS